MQTVSDIVNARRIIDGPEDNLRAVSANRYPWATPLYEQMLANNWDHKQVPLLRDKKQFNGLSKGCQFAYRSALAFLSNLDAIQVDNLTNNVAGIITDPTVRKLLTRQTFEEAVHNDAYSAIIEVLFKDPLTIYNMAGSVPMLKSKNALITENSKQVTLKPTPQNKVKAFVSNIVLEGVYFFSGFLNFYTIARSEGKMLETKDMIKYIQRDELTHLDVFSNIYLSCKQERPEVFTSELKEECQQIFRDAAVLETAWGHYSIQHGVPGLTEEGISRYIENRAEQCARMIGLGGIFAKSYNPYTWMEEYSSIKTMNKTSKNFFEGKNTRYSEIRPNFTIGRTRELAI